MLLGKVQSCLLFSHLCLKHVPLCSVLHSKSFSTSQALSNKKYICFSDYDAIGFDCDHTLVQYHLHHLFQDTYESLSNFLCQEKGYKREIFKYFPGFCSKGLILDLEKGDFMKIGHDGKILRASHGTRMIKDPHNYFPSTTWPHHIELSTSMTNIGSRFRIFENFFDMSSSLLAAQIIDHLDDKHNNSPPSYDIWPDLLEAIMHVYIPDPFKATKAMFFSRWLQETDRFVEKWSVARREWLKRLKTSGGGREKPFFLLSSAYEDFAGAAMDFVFGKDWEEYFDFSIFLAHKPAFFTSKKPFYHLVHGSEGVIDTKLVTEPEDNTIFYGGNLATLQTHLGNITNKQDPKVLFFGDSLRSDTIPCKMYAGWDTVTVLEEMASEQCFHAHRPDNLVVEECEVDDEKKMVWGSVLVDRGLQADVGGSQTMLHHAIQQYSDIAVPNLEFLLQYAPDHQFETFNSPDRPSLSGFHPFVPHVLKSM